jgi:predicted HAD superfamily Cof-like phosphohydrolase
VDTIADVATFTRAMELPLAEDLVLPRFEGDDLSEFNFLVSRIEDIAHRFHDRAKFSKNPAFLRMQLMTEELGEFGRAVVNADHVGMLDALVDMRYVADGTTLTYGFQKYWRSAWNEVHGSNMTKLGSDGRPLKNEAGRVVKGPNYRPPNIEAILYPQKEAAE